jgi:hypothetical protein
MLVITLVLLILAAASFAAAAFNVSARVNLLALGLLFWVLVPLISTIDRM